MPEVTIGPTCTAPDDRLAAQPAAVSTKRERGARGVARPSRRSGTASDRRLDAAMPTTVSPIAMSSPQATAGADADQPGGAEHDQLLEHDAGARAPHAGRLHADRLALEGAGVAEHASLGVDLAEPGVEERLGDVLGSHRIARDRGRWGRSRRRLGSQMDRHGHRHALRRTLTPEHAGRGRYLRNLLVVLSASTLPPVWHVGQ